MSSIMGVMLFTSTVDTRCSLNTSLLKNKMKFLTYNFMLSHMSFFQIGIFKYSHLCVASEHWFHRNLNWDHLDDMLDNKINQFSINTNFWTKINFNKIWTLSHKPTEQSLVSLKKTNSEVKEYTGKGNWTETQLLKLNESQTV